ncbi:CBS domain-containing protein [Streptomyces sp. NPDC001970]
MSHVMAHTAVAVGREAGHKEIVTLMEQWKASALPVVEGEGRVIGVVPDPDPPAEEEHRRDDLTRPDRPLSDAPEAGPSPPVSRCRPLPSRSTRAPPSPRPPGPWRAGG